MTIRGYDIDGVLVPCKVHPVPPYVVISGRKTKDWDRTVAEIGTTMPIYLRPDPMGADCDSISAVADIIRERCPDCEVVLVQ